MRNSEGMSEDESQPTPQRRKRRRTWDEGYADLKAFAEENGHAKPHSKSFVGQWAVRQRNKRQQNELSEHQIELLGQIGFSWENKGDEDERKWEEMFDVLIAYKDHWGTTFVTQKEVFRGVALGAWVSTQRVFYRKNKLKPQRREKLESIGFHWVPKGRPRKPPSPFGKIEQMWQDKFKVLCEYKDQIGDTLVTQGYKGTLPNGVEFDLGMFVKLQREKFRDGLLRDDHYKKLNQIGFVFTIDFYNAETSKHQQLWDNMFERLCGYKRVHGNCEVPTQYDEDQELGTWTANQRKLYRQGRIEENRFQRLDKIGFAWSPLEERWSDMVGHLEDYLREHGDCKVPTMYETNEGANLGTWVSNVRAARRGTNGRFLTPEKIAQLDALGFVWDNVRLDELATQWETMFAGLQRFRENYGHCRVFRDYMDEDDPLPASLWSWMWRQRQWLPVQIEQGDEIAIGRKQRLDDLDTAWQTDSRPSHSKRNGKAEVPRPVSSSVTPDGTTSRDTPTTAPDTTFSMRKARKSQSSLQGADGPDGNYVAFPAYDGLQPPVMFKTAPRHYRKHNRKSVKLSLGNTTRQQVRKVLNDQWSTLPDVNKAVYHAWVAWDMKRYYRDEAIWQERQKSGTRKRHGSSIRNNIEKSKKQKTDS